MNYLKEQTQEVADELGIEEINFHSMLDSIRRQKPIVQQRFIESLVDLYEYDDLSSSLYGDYNEWLNRPRNRTLTFPEQRQTMVIYAVEGKILEEEKQ
jgi:hypothetical protein